MVQLQISFYILCCQKIMIMTGENQDKTIITYKYSIVYTLIYYLSLTSMASVLYTNFTLLSILSEEPVNEV